MSVHETVAVWTDREPTLDEELRALGEEDVFEMANLDEAMTGVPGVITITTAMGDRGPRVKVYLKKGRDQPGASISIGLNPRVLASSVDDRDLARIAPQALAWLALNHEALTTFWFEGESLCVDELLAFCRSLKKV